MRKVTWAIAVTAALITGQLHAEVHKTPPADVGPGRIAWFDITTTQLARSKEFYGKLFDWTFTSVKGTDLAVEIVSRGTSIGTDAQHRRKWPTRGQRRSRRKLQRQLDIDRIICTVTRK